LPGIDQVNFIVPAGVEGCRVPVALKVDGVVSNYATMAISSSSRTCSDPASLPPADMERLRATRDGRMASITLSRFVVPATVLSSLPASSTWTGTGIPSVLGVATRPTVDRARFTAPGLDLGLFYYDSIRTKKVTFR
jgi:hypothetical protein